MTLEQLKTKIENGTVDRTEGSIDEKSYSSLSRLLSSLSKNEINKFQHEFNPNNGFEKFCEGQDELFLKLIELETSVIGEIVREVQHLKPLTLKTELT